MKASYVNWLLSLILLVVGILALVLVYQKAYKPMSEENNKIKSDIELLEISLATQKGYKEKEEFHISETDKLNKATEEILSDYPVDLWEEDHIAYVDYLHKQTGMNVTSLNWGDTVAMAQLSNGAILNSETIIFNYNRSYASLKDLINFMVKTDANNQTSLTTLTIAYDAQKDLMAGSMIVQRYYLSNMGKDHQPAVPEGDIQTGQDNILD